jgi:hypothetical protein
LHHFNPLAQPGVPGRLDEAGLVIASQVFAQRRGRPVDPRAGTNVTITPDAAGVVIASTGGGAVADDASAVLAGVAFQPRPLPPAPPANDSLGILALRALLPHPTPARKVKAGTNVTLVEDAEGVIISAAGGAGNAAEVTIALDGNLVFTTTVVGQAWVTAASKIVASIFAVANGGTTEEMAMASGCVVGIKNRVAGVGFDLWVYNPNGFSGTLTVHVIGV